MRALGFDPDEQKCELYNVDERFLSGQDCALKSRVGRPLGGDEDMPQRCRSHRRVVSQIGRQFGMPIILVPGEAIFESYVLTLDKASVFETLTECGQ